MYGCGGALPADRGTTADPPVPPRPCGAAIPPLARYTTYPFVHYIILSAVLCLPLPGGMADIVKSSIGPDAACH